MANAGLAYDDTPPLAAPFRFFLTAPLFGIAAGLVLLFGDATFSSRWNPAALAVVHLLGAGFMLQVMTGALVQILPVVAGAPIPHTLWVARITHLLLAAGAASLAFGFGQTQPVVIQTGAALLGSGLVVFLSAGFIGLSKAPAVAAASRTPRDLRLALSGLALTAVLGLTLAAILSGALTLPLEKTALVNAHAIWAWLGWGGILLAATSWVVVPMFQITPQYPARFTRYWAPATLLGLVLWSALSVSGLNGAATLMTLLLACSAAAFALQTLHQQKRSRRSVADPSFRSFRLAMLAALAGSGAALGAQFSEAGWWPQLASVLIMHGAFVSAMSAMLYKIVPFLSWLHLMQAGLRAPNVKKLLPDAPVRAQLRLHGLTLASLAGAVFVPTLEALAGLLLVAEFAWLMLNMLRVLRAWDHARKHAEKREYV